MTDPRSRLLATIDEYANSADADSYPVAEPLAALRAVVDLCAASQYPTRSGGWRDLRQVSPTYVLGVIAEQLGIKDQDQGIEEKERRG